MSYSWLPPTLQEIAEVAGLDAALAMANARGGSRISLPAKPKPGHWLIEAVGEEAAQKICAHYATGYGGTSGASLVLPLPPNMDLRRRRMRIDEMLANGVSADKIAVATRTHRTTVFRRQARKRERKHHRPDTSRQSDLFD